MAFWENISQKVNETTNKTVTKAKELSDVVKLNAAISEEERKANDIYNQIGRLYIKLHEEDFEEQFANLVAMAKASNEKIDDYRNQVRVLKGIATCPTCGAEVPNGAAFCNSCGSKLPEIQVEKKPEGVRCTKCGALISEDSRFCTECGHPVVEQNKDEMGETVTIEQVISPIAEEAVEEEAGRACPNCGAHLEDEAFFCTECGTKL